MSDAPELTAEEREIVARFEAAPVLKEAWHEHRWADVTKIAEHQWHYLCTVCGEIRAGERR